MVFEKSRIGPFFSQHNEGTQRWSGYLSCPIGGIPKTWIKVKIQRALLRACVRLLVHLLKSGAGNRGPKTWGFLQGFFWPKKKGRKKKTSLVPPPYVPLAKGKRSPLYKEFSTKSHFRESVGNCCVSRNWMMAIFRFDQWPGIRKVKLGAS